MACGWLLKEKTNRVATAHPSAGLWKSDHGLQLPNGDPPAGLDAATGVTLPQVLVLLNQELGGFLSHLRLEQTGKVDVPGTDVKIRQVNQCKD